MYIFNRDTLKPFDVILFRFPGNKTSEIIRRICKSGYSHAVTPEMVKSAVLIGLDTGPNLSITGSLATILWLVALRREGQKVSAWTF
ncbi:ArsB/NhaD family transporter [Mucilaginibacter ginsenosidivorax]|uniref:ArsB/NhaD family transporter n=1 Tax=Mucilaginibacter ginsenosidivorax TaxID=862126 RepID=UPI001CEF696A|nr:ArsB/NhaD family transporter [Mucilaginibacter ginsenosidivorax]